MSKRNILIIVSSIFLAIAAIRILPAIYTTRETIADTDAPNGENDSQSNDTGTTNDAEQNAQAGGTT